MNENSLEEKPGKGQGIGAVLRAPIMKQKALPISVRGPPFQVGPLQPLCIGPPPHFKRPPLQATWHPPSTAVSTCPSRSHTVPPCMTRERTLNQVTLIGRTCASPIKTGSQEHHPMVVFTIATTDTYFNGKDMETGCHRICVFKKPLRDLVMTHMTDNQQVQVVGSLVYRTTEEGNRSASVCAEKIVMFKDMPNEEEHFFN